MLFGKATKASPLTAHPTAGRHVLGHRAERGSQTHPSELAELTTPRLESRILQFTGLNVIGERAAQRRNFRDQKEPPSDFWLSATWA